MQDMDEATKFHQKMTTLMREMALYHSVLRKKLEEEQKAAKDHGAVPDDRTSPCRPFGFVRAWGMTDSILSLSLFCCLGLCSRGNEQEPPAQPPGGPAGEHGRL